MATQWYMELVWRASLGFLDRSREPGPLKPLAPAEEAELEIRLSYMLAGRFTFCGGEILSLFLTFEELLELNGQFPINCDVVE